MPLINEFSIQLYSMREETQKDFAHVLRKLGEIGYTGVEFAGYGGIDALEMKKLLDECHLKSVGAHISLDRLNNHLEEEIAYHKVLGTKYIVVPGARIEDRASVLAVAENMTAIAGKLFDAGFQFGYHNHAHEFAKDGEDYLLDILFDNMPEKVCMEMDLYWAAYAGIEPLSYLKKYKGRVKLLHVKQILDNETKKCVDLNEGILDFREIILATQPLGVEHYILEQEEFAVSPYVSVKNGFDHIMQL